MKPFVFLFLLTFSVMVYAEKIAAPVLLAPSDAKKDMVKEAVTLTWQKPSNEATTPIFGYRLIVSENSRFNGYSFSNDTCNNSCYVFLEDKNTFKQTTSVRLANKVYYWKVQGFSAKESGLWSTTNTFQTQKTLLIPTINAVNANPNAVIQSGTINFTADLSGNLPDKYSVKLNYGNGLIAMTGSGTSYSLSQTPLLVGKKDFSVGIYDAFNKLKGNTASSSFEIIKGNQPPTIKFAETPTAANLGKSYSVKLAANDDDNNLNSVLIDWGDGATDALDAANNETKTFTHVYQKAGTYSLIANALDDLELKSDDLTYSLTVSTVQTLPTVSSINVSPQSVVSGNSLTFSASLSATLPTGYSVKINYGNGLVKMNGSGTSFNLTATPPSSAAYKIGIYDSNNALKGALSTGNFSVTQPIISHSPTLKLISNDATITVGATYTVKLAAHDEDGNLTQIAINWGDGADDFQTASNDVTLTFSHSYTAAGSFGWSATAYDADNLNSNAISKTVTVSKVADVSPVTKTTGYSKIANNGSVLSDSAKLGANPTDWACTKDNKTGLIWEVKTTDGGLRDSAKTYTNYTPDYPGGSGSKYGDSTNTDGFVSAVNNQSLCGADDWRLPTNEELKGLVVCSDGKYNTLAEGDYGFICKSNEGWNLTTTSPTINATYFPNTHKDATYFPNTQSDWFWSSSPYANYSNYAWSVFFDYGYSGGNDKGNGSNVRLVRG